MKIQHLFLTALLGFSLATCALAVPAITDAEAGRIINAGRDHDVENVQYSRAAEFPEVVAYGYFAYDRGYALQGVIVGKKLFAESEAARKALALHNWDKADGKTREALAKAWVEHISLGFDSIIWQADEDFTRAKKIYAPLSATSSPDGNVTVRVWLHGKSGMRPIRNFYREEYIFTGTGEVKPGKSIDSFEIPTH